MTATATKVLEAMFSRGTLVFGHRGAKAYAPENTLPAFEMALKQGAHGIELDVHRTRDGYPVVIHDFTVEQTTDGIGTITQMTLDQVRELDAGSWYSDKYRGVRVPTLDEVFEAFGQEMFINVEIKTLSEASDGIEEVVVDRIRYFRLEKRVIVSSFNPATLRRFRRLLPTVPIGFLYAPGLPVDTRPMMQDIRYELFHPYFEMITPRLVTESERAGRALVAWTVNDPHRAMLLAEWGVKALITDTPDTVLKVVRR